MYIYLYKTPSMVCCLMSCLSVGKDYGDGDYSNIYDGTEESPCRKPCLQTRVSYDIKINTALILTI